MKKVFLITIISSLFLFSCSKDEGTGGRASISGSIMGTEISASRAEITEISCPWAAVISTINNTKNYWLINSPGFNYIVYYEPTASVLTPIGSAASNRVHVPVKLSGTESANSVANLTETALLIANADDDFYISRNGEVLTLTCKVNGSVVDADKVNTEFNIDTKTQGRNQVTEFDGAFANEDVFIIYGDNDDFPDDDVKTNYDGTFTFSNLRGGSYTIFAYSEDKSNITQPLTPVFESIEIGGKDDAEIGTITIEKK